MIAKDDDNRGYRSDSNPPCRPSANFLAMSVSLNSDSVFEHAIAEHLSVIENLRGEQPVLQRIATQMAQAVLAGNKILWCSNGGSAADSQHLAAEFVGPFLRERRGLPSIALTTDTSVLTSLSNDFGYQKVFNRQVEALCAKSEVLVGISTSGKSRNVCLALKTAHDLGAFTVAFTGQDGGAIAEIADTVLRIPSKDAARIREGHILCGDLLCDWVDLSVSESQKEEKGIATR
jgi:D-sedoheptulose 7-phosphate isomerase